MGKISQPRQRALFTTVRNVEALKNDGLHEEKVQKKQVFDINLKGFEFFLEGDISFIYQKFLGISM